MVFVIGYPLTVARYVPIVDLPFHAAMSSIVRHYGDPEWRFADQFTLHFFASPYASLYLLGAFFSFFAPIHVAMKLAVFVLLACLPLGLAVLFHGSGRSPYLGLVALPLTWNTFTHWGFINFLAAMGLMAAAVGLTLRVLRYGQRRDVLWLAFVLVAAFFTHVFRYPFMMLSVAFACALCFREAKRWLLVAVAAAPSMLFAIIWLVVRPSELGASELVLSFQPGRVGELFGYLFDSYHGVEEHTLAQRSLVALGFCVVMSLVFRKRAGESLVRGEGPLVWRLLPPAVIFFGALVALVMFLTLPMSIGTGWWFVYPREAMTSVFLALGLVPGLPSKSWEKLVCLLPLTLSALVHANFVAANFRLVHDDGERLEEAIRSLPHAPRLGYMVLKHDVPGRKGSVYVHAPAWVQAEKGGVLSWHFASWNVLPVRYRTDRPDIVPPPTPHRFEWTPQAFDLYTRGQHFDWLLVRSEQDPGRIVPPATGFLPRTRAGAYWLYEKPK